MNQAQPIPARPRATQDQTTAREWLLAVLSYGPRQVEQIHTLADRQGVRWSSVKRARESLDVQVIETPAEDVDFNSDAPVATRREWYVPFVRPGRDEASRICGCEESMQTYDDPGPRCFWCGKALRS